MDFLCEHFAARAHKMARKRIIRRDVYAASFQDHRAVGGVLRGDGDTFAHTAHLLLVVRAGRGTYLYWRHPIKTLLINSHIPRTKPISS